MPIEFRCHQCQKLLRTKDDTAGKQAKCPQCGAVLTVPAADSAPPQPVQPVQAAPPVVESDNPYQFTGQIEELQSRTRNRTKGEAIGETATRMKRFLGAFADGGITLLITIPIVAVAFASGMLDPKDPMFNVKFQLVASVAGLPLQIVQWYLITTSGQSIGKKLVHTRIVDNDNGSNPGFLRAVVLRAWVVGLISAIPCAGAIFALVDICWIFGDQKRCLHDLMANTRVINA